MKVSEQGNAIRIQWFEVILEARRVGEWAEGTDGGRRSWEQESSFAEDSQSRKRRRGASKGQQAGGDPREKRPEEVRGGLV